MKSDYGTSKLDIPRDRNGSFELEIVKKNQTTMTGEIEEKILSLFALGNSYAQIAKHIEDFYCVGFSKATISAVTDKIIRMENKTVRINLSLYLFRCYSRRGSLYSKSILYRAWCQQRG